MLDFLFKKKIKDVSAKTFTDAVEEVLDVVRKDSENCLMKKKQRRTQSGKKLMIGILEKKCFQQKRRRSKQKRKCFGSKLKKDLIFSILC